MLPARPRPRFRLADALADCLGAVRGERTAIGLAPVRQAVAVLVDGLGATALQSRAGHARMLAGRLRRDRIADSGFPSTTAAAIPSLTTGEPAGRTGMVGYSVLDPERDRVVQQLSGLSAVDPLVWQRMPTLFERAVTEGVRAVAIGPARYRDTAFTRAALRGAEYLEARTIADRVDVALDALAGRERTLAYLYVPELDQIAHRDGVESDAWTAALESLDAELARLDAGLRAGQGALVTADHGVIDVHRPAQTVVPERLFEGVRHVAGEPRCLQLHLETGVDPDPIAAAWATALGDAAWVATRTEAIEGGLFGRVDPEVAPRIGDLLVGARRRTAFYRDEDDPGRGMVGQHGAASPEETRVPLIGLGAFAD